MLKAVSSAHTNTCYAVSFLIIAVCILECNSNSPCNYEGTEVCYDVKDGDPNYKCDCKPGFGGVHCDTSK